MKRAFTLLELLVVVAIMSMLGVAATGGYNALQRGMAERGATAVATTLLQAAKERALVDRVPTAVFCYNRLLREATDDENAVVVGEAVAVRRAGRVSWAQGNYIVDEFADLCNSYDVESDASKLQQRRGMKLWRFDDRQMNDMRYSVVADAVMMLDIPGVTYNAWAKGGSADGGSVPAGGMGANIGANTEDDDFTKTTEDLSIRAYAFYNLNNSRYEPSTWRIGDGYGFEFLTVQLPHGFVFGSGSIPSQAGDVSFVKAIYFDVVQSSTIGQNTSDESVDIYFCRPDSGGKPHPDHRAGTASSKEDTTL